MLTPTDVSELQALIFRLFPESEWEPEQMRAFTFIACRKPLDLEQARAAVTYLSMRHRYKGVKPAEVIAVLENATAKVALVAEKGDGITKREKNLAKDLALRELPGDLRVEALFRIETMLNRAGSPRTTRPEEKSRPGELSRIGERIRVAALLAETDWVAALEESPFRAEVKACPSVLKWIEGQPLKRLDLSTFIEVSTNG